MSGSGKCKIESGKLIMKKSLILLAIFGLTLSVFAFEYKPKNTDVNPFGGVNNKTIQNNKKTEQVAQPEMREIKTLSEYFKYLPREVHRNWTPYKADRDYEVTVQFVVHRDGSMNKLSKRKPICFKSCKIRRSISAVTAVI